MFEEILKDKPTEQVTVLVDGDIIAYRSAATCDGKAYTISGPPIFERYKKDAIRLCEEYGVDSSKLEVVYLPEPVENALHNVKNMMQSIQDAFPGCKMEVYLSSPKSFRKEEYPTYKSDRAKEKRPTHLDACKEYMTRKYGALIREGLEADDCLSIRSCELGAEGCVICTTDKDLKQIAGRHYNPVKCEHFVVSGDEAERNLWIQVLMGDKTDSIMGIWGMGSKTAEKIIGSVEDGEYWKTGVKEYVKAELKLYPDKDYPSRETLLRNAVAKMLESIRLVSLLILEEHKGDVETRRQIEEEVEDYMEVNEIFPKEYLDWESTQKKKS